MQTTRSPSRFRATRGRTDGLMSPYVPGTDQTTWPIDIKRASQEPESVSGETVFPGGSTEVSQGGEGCGGSEVLSGIGVTISRRLAEVAAFVRWLGQRFTASTTPSPPPMAYDPPARPPSEDEFRKLVAEWKAGRGPTSSAVKMAKHPAYKAIIGFGPAVVPLLLAELKREPDHWFLALHEITGADPVPPAARGRLKEMATAWLEWGKANGFSR